MLLASVVAPHIADTSKRLEKVELLASLLRGLSPEEAELVTAFLFRRTIMMAGDIVAVAQSIAEHDTARAWTLRGAVVPPGAADARATRGRRQAGLR